LVTLMAGLWETERKRGAAESPARDIRTGCRLDDAAGGAAYFRSSSLRAAWRSGGFRSSRWHDGFSAFQRHYLLRDYYRLAHAGW